MSSKENEEVDKKISEIEKKYEQKIKLKDDFIKELLKDFQGFDSSKVIDEEIAKEFELKEKAGLKLSNKLKEKITKIKKILRTQTEIITEKDKSINTLKNKNSELIGNIEKLNEDFSKENIEKKVISNKLIENNATIQKINDELASERNKNREIESQVATRNEQIEELEQVIHNKTIQVNALKEEVNVLEKELDSLKKELLSEIEVKDTMISKAKVQFNKIKDLINEFDL